RGDWTCARGRAVAWRKITTHSWLAHDDDHGRSLSRRGGHHARRNLSPPLFLPTAPDLRGARTWMSVDRRGWRGAHRFSEQYDVDVARTCGSGHQRRDHRT